MSSTFDAEVGVVGVGTMGAMTLWQLARRGVSCIGFEQFRIGHELGAGAGESRQFRANYLEPEVHDVMARAESAYRQLEADSGTRLLSIGGGLTIGPRDCEPITTLTARIRAEGDEPTFLDHAEMAARYPQHRLSEDDVVIWNDRSGFVRPEHAIISAYTVAQRRGARVVTGHPVTSIDPDDGGVVVRCAGRTWTVRRLVITAGAWAWRLLRDVPGTNIGRLLLTWFPVDNDEMFSAQRNPTFIRVADGTTIYGMPSFTAGTVRIGLVGPRNRFNDPDDLDRVHVPAGEIEAISSLVARWMPEVTPTVIRAGTYMDAYTADGQPLVGPVDAYGDVIVAAGFCGRGFKMAPAIGEILADLATVGASKCNVAAWRTSRFTPDDAS